MTKLGFRPIERYEGSSRFPTCSVLLLKGVHKGAYIFFTLNWECRSFLVLPMSLKYCL